VKLARRARQDDHRRAAVDRYHQPRRRADRIEHRRALRHDRLLAIRRADRVRIQIGPARHQRLEDLGDPVLQRIVEHHRTPRERTDDLRGQVVGRRPQPAAGEHEIDPSRGQEAQRLVHVLAAIADDDRVGMLDAELAQALGQPRSVAVAHPPGEDLGTGDHDAGCGAHVLGRHSGQRDCGRRRTLVGVIS
jgi:hypothetical protein